MGLWEAPFTFGRGCSWIGPQLHVDLGKAAHGFVGMNLSEGQSAFCRRLMWIYKKEREIIKFYQRFYKFHRFSLLFINSNKY